MRILGVGFAVLVGFSSLPGPLWAGPKSAAAPVANDAYEDLQEDRIALSADDPWEEFNRPLFALNVRFDRNIAKPLIAAYDVIPAPARHRFGDFLNNLGEPLNLVHGVFQLNPKIVFTSFWRFVLNTTFGLGGLRDFAREEAGLPDFDEGFGKTLGYWGVPSGPYLVLPILGPSSVRNAAGAIGDWWVDPVSLQASGLANASRTVAEGIDARDRNANLIEHLYYESLDPYVATRSAYRQNEAFKAKQGL